MNWRLDEDERERDEDEDEEDAYDESGLGCGAGAAGGCGVERGGPGIDMTSSQYREVVEELFFGGLPLPGIYRAAVNGGG